ncbi:MAG: hypothetical protein V4553_01510 [Bacteroidota bacterium]
MKILILSIFLLVANSSIAQIVIDPTIMTRYNGAVKKLPSEYKQILLVKDFGGRPPNFACYSINTVDTLNKKDKKTTQSVVTIRDVDIVTGKVSDQVSTIPNNPPEPLNLIKASLKGDTLILSLGAIGPPYTIVKIINKKVTGYYQEYAKRDSIFRLKLSDQKTDELNIPLRISSIKLNGLKFEPNQVIYGEISLATTPYYVDDSDFTTGYINKRLRYKFVFKATIYAEPLVKH